MAVPGTIRLANINDPDDPGQALSITVTVAEELSGTM
jgi:hypothetical protein